MNAGQFNIRVYGICINKKNEVLLSDEYELNTSMTKFPGGGLKFGEGPEDCIRREAVEEFGQEINIIGHFYTTHFFQPAMFFEKMQLLSIYYLIDFIQSIRFKISTKAFDFEPNINGSQSFRWVKISDLSQDNLTFPIDKYVLTRIMREFIIEKR
jgi:8-oxo-dGTP diphosphatase